MAEYQRKIPSTSPPLLPSESPLPDLKASKLNKYFYLNISATKQGKHDHWRTRVELNDNALHLWPDKENTQEGQSDLSAKISHQNQRTQEQNIPLYDIIGIDCDRHYPILHLTPHPPEATVSKSLFGEEVPKEACDKTCRYCHYLTSFGRKGEKTECYNVAKRADQSNLDYKITVFLTIFAYLLPKDVSEDKGVTTYQRRRVVLTLPFSSFPVYEHNLDEARTWQRALQHNRILLIEKNYYKHMTTVRTYLQLLSNQRSLLILLNPKSGSGKGKQIFQKQVVPILKESGIKYEVVITTHTNCARETIKNSKELAVKYGGIVIASGDGLFFEVVNGIMEREDWIRIIHRIPLGIIPCGSGNGLAKSITHQYSAFSEEPSDRILNASLTCASGCSAPLDVVRVELYHNNKLMRFYSILSVGWGFIADVDIGSESLRFMGSQRFTLWSIYRLINLNVYKGRVSYLPYWKSAQSSPIAKFRCHERSPESHLDQQQETTNRDKEDPSPLNPPIDIELVTEESEQYALRNSSMPPPLDEPIPTNWITVDDEFVMVHAAYTSHLASDCHFIPEAKLNDGIIYLVLVRNGISRMQLAKFLLNMSTATHFKTLPMNAHHTQIIPVCAFRIEPEENNGGTTDGILTVDGERVPYGPIQAGIIPGFMKVMIPARTSRSN